MSAAIITLFAQLSTAEQSETMKVLVDLLAGGASAPSGGKKASAAVKKTPAVKASAPRAPTGWNLEVQAVREEYGVEGDEEGNALTLPNGEFKWVMSWKDAMVEASARRKAALEASGAAAPSPVVRTVVSAPKPLAAAGGAAARPLPAASRALAGGAAARPLATAAAAAAAKPLAPTADYSDLEFFPHNEKDYLLAKDGSAWFLEEDGSRGAWAGVFNLLTETFDTTLPDPTVNPFA